MFCNFKIFSDPFLTQNRTGTGSYGRKQRNACPANIGKQLETEPKRLRFFFGTTYGPEGRGFESLTACQKIPNPKGFGIFCFYQFTRFSLLHASGDAHIPRDRRTSSHISERQRQRRRSRDDAKFRPRSTGNPACRPKRKSRNHPVSGASLGTFCAHRKYPAGGTDKLIPTPITQKIGLRAAIIRKHR